jgi:hypothetical protein
MPVYRSLVTDQAPNQISYVLEEVVVRGTLYDQDVVILAGDTETKMRPSAAEWLRDAIITEFNMAGLVESSTSDGQPRVKIVVEQFFAEQVNSFFFLANFASQGAITILRVTVTSSDGAVAYDRRFVGHLEDLDQMLYVYPFFFSELNDLGDMLTQSAQKALVNAASETRRLFETGEIR